MTHWVSFFAGCWFIYILNWIKWKQFYFPLFNLFFSPFLSTFTCPEDELNTKPDEQAAGAQHLPTWTTWREQSLGQVMIPNSAVPGSGTALTSFTSCISEMPRDYAESFPECDHVRQETWNHRPKAQGETRLSQKVPARSAAAFCDAFSGRKTDPGYFF